MMFRRFFFLGLYPPGILTPQTISFQPGAMPLVVAFAVGEAKVPFIAPCTDGISS